ncbi:cell wall hydrolase [Thermincola ferriacetica]
MKRSVALTLAVLLLAVTLGGFFVFKAEAAVSYTVKKGDTLYLIGQRFGVSAAALKASNGLTSNTVYPGQRLNIPVSSSVSSGNRYVVQKGDTLYLIAKRFGTTVEAIKSANNYWKDTLYVGQDLTIPQRFSRPTVTVSRSASRSDLDLLARVVYAEARGEPYEGQVAIAAVILNRVKSPNFPNSIAGVIYEPLAFSCVADGQINLRPDQTAYKAAQDALSGWDPTGGALYYWNPSTATSKWVWSRIITKKIGNHVFAK